MIEYDGIGSVNSINNRRRDAKISNKNRNYLRFFKIKVAIMPVLSSICSFVTVSQKIHMPTWPEFQSPRKRLKWFYSSFTYRISFKSSFTCPISFKKLIFVSVNSHKKELDKSRNAIVCPFFSFLSQLLWCIYVFSYL